MMTDKNCFEDYKKLRLHTRIEIFLRPGGKKSTIANSADNAKVLDVGCGNSSATAFRELSRNCHYTGLDVSDYNQSAESIAMMDEYIVVSPTDFAKAIKEANSDFDLIVSSHNLEHCFERWDVLDAMLNKLAVNGMLYLSFPSESSKKFPSRPTGCLNYFDDDTHVADPPNIQNIIDRIAGREEFSIEFLAKNYSPLLLRLIGFLLEPWSILSKTVKTGTWELYGFETILHIRRIK